MRRAAPAPPGLAAEARPPLRSSEWLVIAYFLYVAALAPFYRIAPWRPLALAALACLWFVFASRKPVYRDFAPLAAAIAAYREMDWFTPAARDLRLERAWVVWDRLALDGLGLRAVIEWAGPLLPNFLEMCYTLVYGVAPLALLALFRCAKREAVNRFWMAYLAGTLGAYALFPFFPSQPPRTAFPAADLPRVAAVMRRINMVILGNYGIHSSVFPSAHVSSAFSAAWALLVILPRRRWIGSAFAAYGLCVAIATLYGRYHYAADVVAGLALSLVAFPVMRLFP
ncbi:MAG TPA: phosphatase PAP2 family protein [Bryobacteraceae bacterium]|nr:phosphatase PAP2 family protein [Bryobacteraceae bacterium]